MENTKSQNRYKIPSAEQETTIRWDAESKQATVWTCQLSQIRKIDKLCEDFPETYRCVACNEFLGNESKTYTVASKYIRLGKPSKRIVSPEQRKAAGVRLKEALLAKQQA